MHDSNSSASGRPSTGTLLIAIGLWPGSFCLGVHVAPICAYGNLLPSWSKRILSQEFDLYIQNVAEIWAHFYNFVIHAVF